MNEQEKKQKEQERQLQEQLYKKRIADFAEKRNSFYKSLKGKK
jgi:hypothetical protein